MAPKKPTSEDSTMTYTSNERQRVYTTCRAIFSGNAALLRRPKKVRNELIKNRKPLESLFNEFGEPKLTDIARQLLESRIFESDLRAKVEFPDLFRTSPLQDAQREASEADAAKSLAGLLGELARAEEEDGNRVDANEAGVSSEPVQKQPEGSTNGMPPTPSSFLFGSLSQARPSHRVRLAAYLRCIRRTSRTAPNTQSSLPPSGSSRSPASTSRRSGSPSWRRRRAGSAPRPWS